MKSESGLTTTSIIIYVIAMMLVIGIIATITSFFYTNVYTLDNSSNNISEITKFHMYFLEETNKTKNEIIRQNENSISFSTGNTFSFQDKSIYYNNIRICENISDLEFAIETLNEKQVIKVLIVIGNESEYSKTTEYVMKK